MDNEIFKPVKDFEDIYHISNTGELMNIKTGIDMLHQIKNKEEHEWITKNGLSFFKKIIENDK